MPPSATAAAIRRSPSLTAEPGRELDYRPSYLAAGVCAVIVLLLYLATLAPSTAMWDTSEYIAAAYTLGLPHPPGNPFFVLVGRVFSILPIAPTVAMRINVLAALCSAVSAGMWFLITERVLVGWFTQRWQRIAGGALAVLIGATSFTVWNQSVVNEKVYTVSLAMLAIVSWLTVRWCDEPDGPKADRILVLIAYLLGLGYSNHMAGMLPAPAVAVAVLLRRPATLLRWKLLFACVAALVFGMTPFLTQPIRSAYFPAINEGETTGCATQIGTSCTFSQLTYDRFMYNFNRGQYGKPSVAERQAPFTAQVGMWWLYFKWQYLRDAHGELPGPQTMLAAVFLILGLLGGYVHWQRDRRSFMYFGPLVLTTTLVLITYLNFKYGASQAPELGDTVAREVRDRDYFFLWSFSAWSVWVALGLVWVWESVAVLFGSETVKLGRETVTLPTRRGWLAASPVLALALIPLLANWRAASRAGETFTADFAQDLLNSVEPYGILITVGDNDTFPLWYAQEVEGIRKDVIVANTSLMNTDWYTRQLIRRPVYEYDSLKGPAIYRGKVWKKPSGPPLQLTLAEADSIPLYYELRQPQIFRKDSLVSTIDLQYLERKDILILRMIQDAFPERPLYYSRTSGGEGQNLGFGKYLLTQGLARKLLDHVPKPGPDTIPVQGEGSVDVKRTKALWDIFKAPDAFIKRGDWVDRPSVGIPFLYVSTGVILADALSRIGESAAADSVLAKTEAIARAARVEEALGLRRQPAPLAPLTDSPRKTEVPLRR
jgi:transmembrane protein TMEM260 (protein O-mannosyltransferase)